MARVLLVVALISIIGYTSAVPSTYQIRVVPAEHRATAALRPLKAAEELPYEYQIVPADEYAVAELEYDSSTAETSIISSIASSIWEVLPIPSPFALLKKVALLVINVGKWVLSKGSFVLLGAALVTGFCAFTPFCTIVIEKPFAKQIESLNIPYLDDAEHYLRQAYDKYRELY